MLICICGKIGSGKTTAALMLKEKLGAILFSADQWMVALYGDQLTKETHAECLEKCKTVIYGVVKQLLDRDLTVVLDFGFWTRRERDAIRLLFHNYRVQFFYLPISTEEQERRVLRRNTDSQKTYVFTIEMLRDLNGLFEAPNETEHDVVTEINRLE